MYNTETIKANNPLLGVVEAQMGPAIKRSGRINFFRCPFHDDADPSFAVFEDDGFYCYGCGAHGDVIDFVMKAFKMDFLTACSKLGGGDIDPIEAEKIAKARLAREHERLVEQQKRYQQALKDLQDAQAYRRYMENQTDYSRQLWVAQGIPPAWQEFFKLGYAPDFWAGPSLTMPIFKPLDKFRVDAEPVLLNIRHRLIGAENGDKYRPEQPGLGQQLFVADWELPLDGQVIMVEGEKKCMVSFLTLNDPDVQVVGIPGKRAKPELLKQLDKCELIYIIPDPDGIPEAHEHAEILGRKRCRLVELPDKVDDMIVKYRLDARWIQKRLWQAVRM